MNICYPESYKCKIPQISWGCSHEEEAYNSYKNIVMQHHPEFQLAKSGLITLTEFPFIVASPDGLVLCSCCGKECAEITCPFNQRGNCIFEPVKNDNFYLTKVNNSIKILVTHQYYYQVQTQIHVTKK